MTRQNQQNECAPSEDSDQPGHPPSLIRVFAVRMRKYWVLSYPLSAQRRRWSDLVDTQAELSLRWAHTHFVGFVMSWLLFVSAKSGVKLLLWLASLAFLVPRSELLTMKPGNQIDWFQICFLLQLTVYSFQDPSRICPSEKCRRNVFIINHLSHDTIKCVFGCFRPGQTQSSLRSHRS